MAEKSVQSVLEDERRQAVSAIANAGAARDSAVRNTATGIADVARRLDTKLDASARSLGGSSLADELRRIVDPALTSSRAWAPQQAQFERRITADQGRGAGDFFAGARSAVPIVMADASSARSAAEAELLRAVINQELGVGQSVLSFRQALENRQAAREAQEFQRQQALRQQAFQEQAHNETLALQQQAMAFQEAEAARAAQQQAATAAVAPPPQRTFGEAMAARWRR